MYRHVIDAITGAKTDQMREHVDPTPQLNVYSTLYDIVDDIHQNVQPRDGFGKLSGATGRREKEDLNGRSMLM
jgi:hypothetical protein